ncbi:MAG TPA: translocation/assembly module TamB domain-containing protein [Candidatus Angelobacter sp.]|nr:translocation/assembly module TamB domain-containing protein [Candidatus Angelobacter sp.]
MTASLPSQSPVSSPVPSKDRPSQKPQKSRWRSLRRIGPLTILLLTGSLILYLNSDAFQEAVRKRVVAELEHSTGGRAEIRSSKLKLWGLQFEANGIAIHGSEGPKDAPYLQADRILVQGKILSLFSRRLALSNLLIEHPVVDIIVYPDGRTNQPTRPPSESQPSSGAPIVDLAVERVEINNGELLFNQHKIPFEMVGERFSAGVTYSAADKSYVGNVSLSLLSARYRNSQPLHGDLGLSFRLGPTQAEITSLKLAVDHSTLDASGTVVNYNRPAIQLRYKASLDLPELAKTVKVAEIRTGRLDLDGSAKYENGRYALEGRLHGYGLGWRDSTVNFAGIELMSPFTFDPEKLSLSKIAVRGLGGKAAGDFQLANWSAPATEKKNPQKASAKLHLERMELDQILAAFFIGDPLASPQKAGLGGAVSGEVGASWEKKARDAVIVADVKIDAPLNRSDERIPFSGEVKGSYGVRDHRADIIVANLTTPKMQVNGSGALAAQNSQFNFTLNAVDIIEFQPILDYLRTGLRLPIHKAGRTSFHGSLFGIIFDPSVKGHLELQNFDTPAELFTRASQSTHGRNIHWDSLASDLVYTPFGLRVDNGQLRHGSSTIAFSGTLGLDDGRFDAATSEIAATGRVDHIDVGEVQSLAGLQYPVGAILGGSIHMNGTANSLRGSGDLQLTGIVAYGEPFRSFKSDFSFDGTESQFKNILLAHNGAKLSGSAAYSPGNKAFRFDLTGTGISIEDFHRFVPQRVKIEGKAEFHFTGAGSLDAPIINGQASLRNLVLNGEQVGDLTAKAETHGVDLHLSANSSFRQALFTLDGDIQLRDDFPGKVTVKFDHLNFDPLILAYLQGKITEHSSLDGSIELRGPMKNLRSLSGEGTIQQLAATVENVKLKNNGPIHFSFAKEALQVDQFHIGGDGTDLSLHGGVQLVGAHNLDLQSNGHLNLKLLEGYYPGVVPTGMTSFTVHAAGPAEHPRIDGNMEVVDGGLAFTDFPNGLSQINGSLAFAEDRIQIRKLTARTGGGLLDLGGFITYRNGVYFDVTATGKDIRLRYPAGLSSSASANLRYTGSAQSSVLSGDVIITRFAINPHFDFAQYLASSKNSILPSAQNPFLDNLRLDVRVATTPELRVETSLAKVSGDADLRLRGTVGKPAVLGRVNIAEGDISLNGTRYRLERGDIAFTNPQMIQPVVNAEISARVRDYDIVIGFHGPIDKLSTTYRSDPPLPTGDIIALLAFGRTRTQDVYNSQPGQNLSDSLTDNATDAVLGQALSTVVGSRVQRLFGVSSVKIDPQIGGQVNNPNPRVTIEQQIKNNLTVTYVSNLSQSSAEQVIQVEYNVTKGISIVAVRDQNGILSFDVRLKKRKR